MFKLKMLLLKSYILELHFESGKTILGEGERRHSLFIEFCIIQPAPLACLAAFGWNCAQSISDLDQISTRNSNLKICTGKPQLQHKRNIWYTGLPCKACDFGEIHSERCFIKLESIRQKLEKSPSKTFKITRQWIGKATFFTQQWQL